MLMLARNPSEAYRRVELDARIEASSGGDLTLICLEEVVATLGQVLVALGRDAQAVPVDALSRAHSIASWLARSVAKDNPLHEAMTQFYGGLAMQIAHNMRETSIDELTQVREDFADILAAAKAA